MLPGFVGCLVDLLSAWVAGCGCLLVGLVIFIGGDFICFVFAKGVVCFGCLCPMAHIVFKLVWVYKLAVVVWCLLVCIVV